MKKVSEDFWKYVHEEARRFRRKKITEIFSKENPDIFELEMITFWANHYGREI